MDSWQKNKLELIEREELPNQLVFKIGENGEEESIKAVEIDIRLYSKYLAALIDTKADSSNEIKIVQKENPKIFKMVIDFCHIQSLQNELESLEDGVQLAAMAQKFGIQELVEFCSKLLTKLINLGNVWITFDKYHETVAVFKVCQKLLSENTEALLQQEAFLNISEKALESFLTIKELNVKSEMSLVKACIKYAEHNKEQNKKELFRSRMLRNLRLFSVNSSELWELAPMLTPEDCYLLVQQKCCVVPFENAPKIDGADSICSEKVVRGPETLTFDFNTRPGLEDTLDVVLSGDYEFCHGVENKFKLGFDAKQPIEVVGVEIFCPINLKMGFLDSESLIKFKDEVKGETPLLPPDSINVRVTILHQKRVLVEYQVKDRENEMRRMNVCETLPTQLCVPKDACVQIEVLLKGPACVRKVRNAADVMIRESALLDKIEVQHLRKDERPAGAIGNFESPFKSLNGGALALGVIKALKYRLI